MRILIPKHTPIFFFIVLICIKRVSSTATSENEQDSKELEKDPQNSTSALTNEKLPNAQLQEKHNNNKNNIRNNKKNIHNKNKHRGKHRIGSKQVDEKEQRHTRERRRHHESGHLNSIHNSRDHDKAYDYDKDSPLTKMVLPPRPHLTHMTENSVLVEWKAPEMTQDSLPWTFIKIQFKEVFADKRHPASKLWKTVDDDISPSLEKYIVSNLHEGSRYVFRLSVVYSNKDNRFGRKSKPFTAGGSHASINSPRFAPFIVELKALDPHSLSVTWQQTQEPAIKIMGFHLQYKEYHQINPNKIPLQSNDKYYGVNDEDDGEDGYNQIDIVQPRVLSHVISNLHAKTQYSVRVRSYNKQGRSRFSNVVVKETLAVSDVENKTHPYLRHLDNPQQAVFNENFIKEEDEEEEEEDDDESYYFEEDEDDEDDDDKYYNIGYDNYDVMYDDYKYDYHDKLIDYQMHQNYRKNGYYGGLEESGGVGRNILHDVIQKEHLNGGVSKNPYRLHNSHEEKYGVVENEISGAKYGQFMSKALEKEIKTPQKRDKVVLVDLQEYTWLKNERVLLIALCCVLSFILFIIITIFVLCLKKKYLLNIQLTKVPYDV